MLIREQSRDTRTLREVKVNLPDELRLRLHRSKLLRGDPISEIVARAVERYLAERAVPTEATEAG